MTSELVQAPMLSPNTSTRGRRSGGRPASRWVTPHSSNRNWPRPSATFCTERNDGYRAYWMQQVAMSPRVRNSAASMSVWSTQPVPVGEISSSTDRSNAPVRSSSARASSARPVWYSGSLLNPT